MRKNQQHFSTRRFPLTGKRAETKWLVVLAISTFMSIGAAQGNAADDNPHGEMKTDCEGCHITASWKEVTFGHEGIGFDLTFSHKGIDCVTCHDLRDFSEASPACLTCHPDIHSSRMGDDCERCHTTLQWDFFDPEEIHSRTRFPLLDRHIQVDCRNCHPALLEGDFATSARDCIDCHEEDYLSTRVPSHVPAGISTFCAECHEPMRWRPALFPSHDSIFPIFSGEHEGVWNVCEDCHPDPSSFSIFTCLSCHHRGEMDEEHRDLQGYSYDSQVCLDCHPTGSVEGGDFQAHDQEYFPIYSGTHVSTWGACADCHEVSGDFSVYTCLSCHDHNQVEMDGRHQGVPGYSYDSLLCLGCHPTGEIGDFREHDALYFPIYSGKHRGEWDECTICHIRPGMWSVFSCIECHEHNRSEMDEAHREVDGYVYDSQACYDCHPRGEEMIRWRERRVVQ